MLHILSNMEPSSLPQEDHHDEYFKDNVIFNIIFLSFIAIFINIGNFLILAAFKKYRFVRNMDILIAFLALMDYISSWVVLPIAIYTYTRDIDDNEVLERVLCKISAFGFLFIQLASTIAITLMTSDRFAAVKKPFFYRRYCEKRPKHIKIVLTILCILLLGLSGATVFLEDNFFSFRDGICAFGRNWSWGKLILLFIGLCQIPIVVCCYTVFVLTVRKLDRKRSSYLRRLHQPKPCNNGGCRLLLTHNRPGNRSVNTGSCQRAPLNCSPPIPLSKDLYVNRGSRLSGTVALAVGIHYIPWIIMLLSMMIEMFTKDNYDVLHYVATRLVLMESMFNPFIYARMTRYATAFREIACCPFRYCGCYTKPYPDGMTASEVHRIVNRMAFEEWESPGLNRRIYSKRKIAKKPSDGCCEESLSELTGNSRMMTSNSHLSETLENTPSVYKVSQNLIREEGHRELKTKQERRQSDSRIIDNTSTETAMHQKSLSNSCIQSCSCQGGDDEAFPNYDHYKDMASSNSDSAIHEVDFNSHNPSRIETSIKTVQEIQEDLSIDNFVVDSRHYSSFSGGDKNNTSKRKFQDNKHTKRVESYEINDICECSCPEVTNITTVQYNSSVHSADHKSATTCSKPDCKGTHTVEGYCKSNNLECQKSKINKPQSRDSNDKKMKTKILQNKDDLTVLLRTRVENMTDSSKVKFHLEVLDPRGLIKLQGKEGGDDKNLPASSDSSVPNFVFSLKENRFVVDESSGKCQNIKTVKINYILKRLSGEYHDDNEEVIKPHGPICRNEIKGVIDVNDLLRTAPLNDNEYLTAF